MALILPLYMGATAVGGPLARTLLTRRATSGKEDTARLSERMGHASLARPAGRLVWFHAASVGESLSTLPLIERLREDCPGVAVLVTSGTVTSARLLADRLPAGTLHQFAPVDCGGPVDRFLDHWRPDVAVWIESEIWPRMVLSVERRGIPALLLNARLSARSRRHWSWLRWSARRVFGTFRYVQAQDPATATTLVNLGVHRDRLCTARSFKQSARALPADATDVERLQHALAGRLTWLASSTHAGEERMAIAAHRHILDARPDALLILVPRHPERGPDLATLLDASGLPWDRRGGGPPKAASAVHLADTLGELGLWYRIASVAFVGGSTAGVGGHNPFEPAQLGVPILHGPDTSNFAAAYRELDAAGGARLTGTSRAIADAVLDLARTQAGRDMAARARDLVGRGEESLDLAMGAIRSALD
jgi:3-deoxy-D-manno-octulosonic-acid transferase